MKQTATFKQVSFRAAPATAGWAFPRGAIFVFGALALIATIQAHSARDAMAPLLGAAIVGIGLLPSLAWRMAAPRDEAIPLLPSLTALHAVYFGLPALSGDAGEWSGRSLDTSSVRVALWASLIGLVALILGYRFMKARGMPRPLQMQLDPTRSLVCAVGLIVTGLAFRLIPALRDSLSSWGQLLAIVDAFVQVGVGILFVRAIQGGLSGGYHLLMWGLAIPAAVIDGLSSGSVANLAFLFLFLMMLTWAHRKRVPWALVLLLVVAIVLIRASAEEYRRFAWHTQAGRDTSAIERTELFLTIAVHRFGGDAPLGDALDLMAQRTNHLGLMAHVADLTPHQIPYWEGHTLRHLPSSLIPRALWPDKPEKLLGQEFGHRYRILDSADRQTSINCPMAVELFANFGVLGVGIGMLLVGMSFGVLSSLFNHTRSGAGALVIGAFLFSRAVNIESDISLVFGSIPHTAVCLWFIVRLGRRSPLRRRGRR